MKPLLRRILGTSVVQRSRKQPAPFTLNSLYEHQRVSVVGWIANKLGQSLQLDGYDRGALLYRSLHKTVKQQPEKDNPEDCLLYLADRLVFWIESQENVHFKIKEMKLSENYHKSILAVYEEIKLEDSLYFNKKSANEISEEDLVWEIYRDVLHASSQGKFLLIRDEEVYEYKDGKVICNESIIERADIPKVRNIAKEALINEGLSSSQVSGCILLISEAITNIIKHAKDGRMIIVTTEKSINIIIEDTGSGFQLKTLPYTTLMAGYSTKKSLGHGFTLMMKLANRVLLRTSAAGSTIILGFINETGGYEKTMNRK